MQKTFILLGAIFLACSAQAQSTDNNTIPADSTHHHGTHRNWASHDGSRNRDGGREGFRSFGHPGGYLTGGPGMGRGRGERVHYTPEQRRQMRDINTDYHNKAAGLFKNDNMTLGQYKAALIALQKDKKSKMQALLTPEQKERLAKAKQRMSENRQVMAAARMERLKIRLNLTDQQVTALRAKEEALHAQLKAIHENDDLLPQQKMEQYKELSGKRKDILKSVLTPDQQTRFSEMESAHEGREHRQMPGMREEGK